MKMNHLNAVLILGALLLSAFAVVKLEAPMTKLKEALAGKFYIGTALNAEQITGKDTASVRVVKEQFSAIVA